VITFLTPGHDRHAPQCEDLRGEKAPCLETPARALASHGRGRLAIRGVDDHHGNGTQGLFCRSVDVPFASLLEGIEQA